MSKKSSKADASVPKFIVLTGQFLNWISPFLAEKYARELFITPIRHKIPKREFHMEA